MRYSKGIMWLDDCRIPFVDENINFDRPRLREKKDWVYDLGTTWENPDVKEYNQQGRFTPNLLVCDDMLNDGTITLSQGGNSTNIGGFVTAYADENKRGIKSGFGDKGTNSRYYDLDKWFDKVIDEIR